MYIYKYSQYGYIRWTFSFEFNELFYLERNVIPKFLSRTLSWRVSSYTLFEAVSAAFQRGKASLESEKNTGCRRQQILLYTSLYLLLRSVLVPCLGSFLGFPGNRQMSPLKNDDTTSLFPVSKLSVRIARWSHHYSRVSGWHQQRQLRPPLALQFQLLQHCIPMLPIRRSLFGRLHNRRKEFL